MNEKSACVAHSPLDALIVNNFTIVGDSYLRHDGGFARDPDTGEEERTMSND